MPNIQNICCVKASFCGALVLGFKVPTQYSCELIAQRPLKLGRVERLVSAQAEPPNQSSSKKARTKDPKQRGTRSNTDGAASDASQDVVAVPP